MAQLELINVRKSFEEDVALNGISLECEAGEFLCLLGPSGAGKTTTLNVISGLEIPDEGQVIFDGEDITNKLPQERNMAVAFESYALYPHLSVFDNIAFPLRAPVRSAGRSQEDMASEVRSIAEMLAIDELLDRYPRQLSGGQRQRVALGRALIRKPSLYLLDEPIAHLDAKLRHRMRAELKSIQLEFGISSIYATPDQLEALSMADRIVVLNNGNIEQVGSPDDIYLNPANVFVAVFVGDPPMNVFPAEVRDGRIKIQSEVDFSLPLPAEANFLQEGQQVQVGFRPVDVQVKSTEASEAAVRGEVIDLDTLGQSTNLTIAFDSMDLKAKVETGVVTERGTKVGVEVDASRLYFFDPESGKNLA